MPTLIAVLLSICPACLRPLERGKVDGYEGRLCTPSSCDAWTVTHKYDHDRREWRPHLRSVS